MIVSFSFPPSKLSVPLSRLGLSTITRQFVILPNRATYRLILSNLTKTSASTSLILRRSRVARVTSDPGPSENQAGRRQASGHFT